MMRLVIVVVIIVLIKIVDNKIVKIMAERLAFQTRDPCSSLTMVNLSRR